MTPETPKTLNAVKSNFDISEFEKIGDILKIHKLELEMHYVKMYYDVVKDQKIKIESLYSQAKVLKEHTEKQYQNMMNKQIDLFK